MFSSNKFWCLTIILLLSNTLNAKVRQGIAQSTGNVYVATEDTIKGDVRCEVGNIVIDGVVDGDVECEIGEVKVNGIVTGDVRVKVGEIYNYGEIMGNTTVSIGEVYGAEIEEKGDVKAAKKVLEGIAFNFPIVSIKVSGMVNVPGQVIRDTMAIHIGDTVDIDKLIRTKKNIEALQYFKTVALNVVREDKGVRLEVKVEENPKIEEVKIEGKSVFSTDELLKELAIPIGEVLKGSVDEKKRVIESMYHKQGYKLAKVTTACEGGVLTFKIDEGYIDKIEITGNKRISTKAIFETLAIKEGDLYNEDKVKEAVKRLEEQFPVKVREKHKVKALIEGGKEGEAVERHKVKVFKLGTGEEGEESIEEALKCVKHEKGVEKAYTIYEEKGKNVLRIPIEEKDFAKTDFFDLRYNRVEGLWWAANFETRTFMPNDWKLKIMGGYAFTPKLWEYRGSIEKPFFYPHTFTIGGEYRNIVDTQDSWIISEGEETASSFFLNRDYYDYYTRQGAGIWLSQVVIPKHKVKIEYNADKYGNIEASDVWTMFNKDRPTRENPQIDEGYLKSIAVAYSCEIGNKTHSIKSWIGVEKAGDQLGGDFEFTRYILDLRSYNELFASNFLDFRVRIGYSNNTLPMQRRFYLGDVGTLHGYYYKEFSGNTMFLGNIEYRLGSKTPQLAILADAGNAWERGGDFSLSELKPSIGLGIQSYGGGFRISVHRRLDKENAPLITYVRFSKTF
ncbi:MAG: POTRA domain-containing protein [bacterium]|nr:POTRA domain-containing protein [bacterium]